MSLLLLFYTSNLSFPDLINRGKITGLVGGKSAGLNVTTISVNGINILINNRPWACGGALFLGPCPIRVSIWWVSTRRILQKQITLISAKNTKAPALPLTAHHPLLELVSRYLIRTIRNNGI